LQKRLFRTNKDVFFKKKELFSFLKKKVSKKKNIEYDNIIPFIKKRIFPEKKFFPLFTPGQGNSNVQMPITIYRKVSHLYATLLEKKKFCILYGISNQKKLFRQLQKNGKFNLSLCERKIDVLFLKTGFFQSIPQVQKEINHKRLYWNGEKILSFSIQCRPGDFFQLQENYNFRKHKYIFNLYRFFTKNIKRSKYPVFFTEENFQKKKIFFLLKKILSYTYLQKVHSKKKYKTPYRYQN
jgi:ribosomal protein S4